MDTAIRVLPVFFSSSTKFVSDFMVKVDDILDRGSVSIQVKNRLREKVIQCFINYLTYKKKTEDIKPSTTKEIKQSMKQMLNSNRPIEYVGASVVMGMLMDMKVISHQYITALVSTIQNEESPGQAACLGALLKSSGYKPKGNELDHIFKILCTNLSQPRSTTDKIWNLYAVLCLMKNKHFNIQGKGKTIIQILFILLFTTGLTEEEDTLIILVSKGVNDLLNTIGTDLVLHPELGDHFDKFRDAVETYNTVQTTRESLKLRQNQLLFLFESDYKEHFQSIKRYISKGNSDNLTHALDLLSILIPKYKQDLPSIMVPLIILFDKIKGKHEEELITTIILTMIHLLDDSAGQFFETFTNIILNDTLDATVSSQTANNEEDDIHEESSMTGDKKVTVNKSCETKTKMLALSCLSHIMDTSKHIILSSGNTKAWYKLFLKTALKAACIVLK